jgi:hypothetical protein
MNTVEEFIKHIQEDPELFMDFFNKKMRESYNSGLDTAIRLVSEFECYSARMDGTLDTLICGLESSKVK